MKTDPMPTHVKRYEDAATRFEHRGYDPPTAKYVDELVQAVKECGVEANWHSAVDPDGRALFPSKVYPHCHPKADLDSFRYLIDSLHAVGRPVLSWYCLNSAIGVVEAHPDWKMIPIPWAGHGSSTDHPRYKNSFVCYNSPYGGLAPKFAAEIVKDVGFDGVWFDGATFAVMNKSPGCVCEFCRERFRKDTGLELPAKVDFENRDFRVWINWRYDVFMALWADIVKTVTAARPDAVVCFNNYRRRTGSTHLFNWHTAIPMRPLELDAIMSGELDLGPGPADIIIKINKAYGFKRGVETWWGLGDLGPFPDVDPMPAVQSALGCISAGGIASCGTGPEPKELVPVLRQMQAAASPRIEYVGGETVEYAAILASQQTMDFWGKENSAVVWDQIHGMNEICRHAHLQTSVIFDAHLNADVLSRYPVVMIGNAACLGAEQAGALADYVKAGGVLVACAHAGEFDPMGYPHTRPVLDDLLGVTRRSPGDGPRTFRILDNRLKAEIGPWITFATTAFDAEVDTKSVRDVVVLAESTAYNIPLGHVVVKPCGIGLWKRALGQGWIVFTPADVFGQYLRTPSLRSMRLFKVVLTELVKPSVTLEGPMCVSVNTRIQADGRWAVHLHNSLATVCSRVPGEINAANDLTLVLENGSVRSAVSGVTGHAFEVVKNTRVPIPRVHLHDVILLAID